MINLIQDLVPLLSKDASDQTNLPQTGETCVGSWLLEQFHSRVRDKGISSDADGDNKNRESHNYDLLLATEVASFMKLAMRLPPYLLFADLSDASPDLQSIRRVGHFINSYLRPYMSNNCCLPFDVTLYIFKALLSHIRRPLHGSRTTSNPQLMSEFMKDCPLFFASIQYYWKQLRPLTVTLGDVTFGALNQAELLLNWKNRVENSQVVSLRELESMDASLVATFIAANLYSMSSKVMTIFIRESKTPTAFGRKLAVCLLDCIMAEFSQMILHGRGIGDNAVLRDTAWKLLRCFPKALSVFRIDESIEFKEALLGLRSQILKEQLTRLYPALFFSFFASFPSEVLQEAVRISGFLQVMLCMYNSFVSLRKECLSGVVNMAAVCSPLHLDFCHQVTKFVRDCVLSSPVESLRNLSKDVIASCSSELRQFLQSQLTKRQGR